MMWSPAIRPRSTSSHRSGLADACGGRSRSSVRTRSRRPIGSPLPGSSRISRAICKLRNAPLLWDRLIRSARLTRPAKRASMELPSRRILCTRSPAGCRRLARRGSRRVVPRDCSDRQVPRASGLCRKCDSWDTGRCWSNACSWRGGLLSGQASDGPSSLPCWPTTTQASRAATAARSPRGGSAALGRRRRSERAGRSCRRRSS